MSQPVGPAGLRNIFIVSPAPGERQSTLIYPSLRKLGLAPNEFHIVENNTRGLPEVYNEFLDRFMGKDVIVVLTHSDVRIADATLREKLSESSRLFDIIGLVGSSHFEIDIPAPDYRWELWPPEVSSGALEHLLPDGSCLWSSYGPTPRRCVVMDGVFLAIDMLKIGRRRFDPRFSFHLYDLDFCLSAHIKKLALGTTNVYAQHASTGQYESQEYRRAVELFRGKWNAIIAANREQSASLAGEKPQDSPGGAARGAAMRSPI